MFWLIGRNVLGNNRDGCTYEILNDEDNSIETLTREEVNDMVRHGNFIKYKEGSIIGRTGSSVGKRVKSEYYDYIILNSWFVFIDDLGIIINKPKDFSREKAVFLYIKEVFSNIYYAVDGEPFKAFYAESIDKIHFRFLNYPIERVDSLSNIKSGSIASHILYNWAINDISSSHPLFQVWYNMITRCLDKTDPHYKYYGGRGIYVAESFRRASDFVKWYESQPNAKFREEFNLELDKDFYGKGYYGADSCILLPHDLNVLLQEYTPKELPRFCSSYISKNIFNCVRVELSDIFITDDIVKNFSFGHQDSFFIDLVHEFMSSRGITDWKYDTDICTVGKKYYIARELYILRTSKKLKEYLVSGCIPSWVYCNFLARLYKIKITD